MLIIRTIFKKVAAIGLSTLVFIGAAWAEDIPTVKIGVLKFGTVNWVMDVIEHHELDKANGINLEVVKFANGDASTIAFQGGELDIFVDDWTWVSSQRAKGREFVISPYSAAVGAIMVPADSDIQTLADLKGKKLGVAGGPVDKSLLLLRALSQRDYGFDIGDENELAFGAPPLLAEKAASGELDAVLNFWHYCARLEGKGFRQLIGADEAAMALGAKEGVAMLGYVFKEAWANEHADIVNGFLSASRQAQELLKTDVEWQRIRPITKAPDDTVFSAYKRRFIAGIPRNALADEIRDVEVIYPIIAELGGNKAVGDAKTLAAGTYWRWEP